jgi:hypothetical protein
MTDDHNLLTSNHYFSHDVNTDIIKSYFHLRSRDSIVGRTTGYGLDNREVGVRVLVGSRIFSSPQHPDWLWAHPASYPMGTKGSFLRVKQQGRESDHSLVLRSRKCGSIHQFPHTP